MEAPKCEVHNGVSIRRLASTGFGRGTLVGRALDYASFYVQVLSRGLFGPRRDCVIYLTTPSILSFVGRVVWTIRGQRYGVWSMDLHPEIEEALGIFREGRPFTRLLHACARAGDRGAEFVVDLGPHMKRRLVARGVEEARTRTIPVWSWKEEIEPVAPGENPLRAELGLDGRLVIMYSGNAGLAHRFDEVLEAMRRLAGRSDLYFLFVGGGPRRAEIERFAETHAIRNFRYLDYFPRDQLKHSISIGDVHLLTLREDMAGLAVPSKLYGILAAGRPVIVIGPRASEPAETVETGGFGMVIDPEGDERDPVDALVSALHELQDRELRAQMGRRARTIFLERYERDVACRQWAGLLRREQEK